MSRFTILYDEPQEFSWFRGLHPDLADARGVSITEAQEWPSMRKVLLYDRPDIVLLDGQKPILSVEETSEVPSGHNVGQRFARIAAAAEAGVPFLYYGPYVAQKHGGITAGPRYMNARLFHALDAMVRITGTAVTTINWPVDARYELLRGEGEGAEVREYLATFLALYACQPNLKQLNQEILRAAIHLRMVTQRNEFVRTKIRNPGQYHSPPGSVDISILSEFRRRFGLTSGKLENFREIVTYKVGMNGIRSDPYTGMSMLYRYLYVMENAGRALVLWFPNITMSAWREAAGNGNRKDVRLFRITADAILFHDGLVLSEDL